MLRPPRARVQWWPWRRRRRRLWRPSRRPRHLCSLSDAAAAPPAAPAPPAPGRPTLASIPEALRLNCLSGGERVAVEDAHGMRLTFAEFYRRVELAAAALRLMGLERGDFVAFCSSNRAECVEIYAACALGGFVCAPVNCCLEPGEMAPVLHNSNPKVVFFEERLSGKMSTAIQLVQGRYSRREDDFVPHLVVWGDSNRSYEMVLDAAEQFAGGGAQEAQASAATSTPPAEEDEGELDRPWLCLHSSGTTGTPKGVLRSQRSMIYGFLTHVDMRLTRKDKALLSWPMHGINPAFFAFHFLYIGASLVTLPLDWYGIDKDTASPKGYLDALEETESTFISLSPAHFDDLLRLPEHSTRTRDNLTILLTGARATAQTKRSIKRDLFPNAELYEAYGSTEAGLVSLLKIDDDADGPNGEEGGSVGVEVPGLPVQSILDSDGKHVQSAATVGELVVKTPMMFQGYHNNDELNRTVFTADGYFRTGDLACRDRKGNFVMKGRKDRVICLAHGWNIIPSEVEEALERHPAVKEAIVLGKEDADGNTIAGALLVLADEARGANGSSGEEKKADLMRELMESLDGTLAKFKHPREFAFVESADEIPRSLNQKVAYGKLDSNSFHWCSA